MSDWKEATWIEAANAVSNRYWVRFCNGINALAKVG